MTAQALLTEVWGAGIVIRASGSRLHIEAKPGTVTAELRERLAASKADLIPLLQKTEVMRARLLALAKAEGIDPTHVYRLHDDDVAAYAAVPDFTDDNLRAHLRALVGSARMDDGLIPLEWGKAVARTCEGCGPVLLWATCPEVVKACPWCFRRKAGKAIPRPYG